MGQNGRIWIDGDPDDILIAMGAVRMIADRAHVHGLTNNVKEYLQGAKGIDPKVEAEEERKRAEEEPRSALRRSACARSKRRRRSESRPRSARPGSRRFKKRGPRRPRRPRRRTSMRSTTPSPKMTFAGTLSPRAMVS